MNILFLVFHGFSESNGISKKIHYQVDALKACGHQVGLCHYSISNAGHRMRMVDDHVLEDFGVGILAKIKKRVAYDSIYKHIIKNNIQMVYVRSDHNSNPFTIHLFRKLRKAGVKVVMEIPTFPYDQEYKGYPLSYKLELLTDQCFRKQLTKQLIGIVTFSDYPQIFGAPTICISNGIDFEQIKVKHSDNKPSQAIHLIAVAEVHYWHGYDRVIKGMGEYYSHLHSKEVFLHIVGGVAEKDRLEFEALIQTYDIEKQILFHGQKFGKELDQLFEQSHFAMGSLARHRSGITRIKTLKNREYAARGIPFIYSETDNDFEQMPYILKASADESPIEIASIIDFCCKNAFEPMEIRQSIQHLSWKEQMQTVVNKTIND